MTEKQRQTIQAFTDWMQDNKISHLIIAADEGSSIFGIGGNKQELTAYLAFTLTKDKRVRDIISMALRVALLAKLTDMKLPEATEYE